MRIFRKETHELTMTVLRFATGSVFLWYGVDKWVHPEAWFAWMPSRFLAQFPVSIDLAVAALGTVEFAAGVLLVAGAFLRPVAAFGAAFMLLMGATLGASEVGVGANGLAGTCLALFLHANARSKRPVSADIVSAVCTLYVLYLFIYGIYFLRSGV